MLSQINIGDLQLLSRNDSVNVYLYINGEYAVLSFGIL